MKEITTAKEMQRTMKRLRRAGRSIGFVPTMGALHEGHLWLVRAARAENEIVAVSIFVNPAQFGPEEDLKKYPRPIQHDRALLVRQKVDYLFHPPEGEMYSAANAVFVDVDPSLSGVLCGKFRPGHFRGVATIVAKLFNLAQPARAYFGEKDFQQAVIIRRLIRDLNFDIYLRVLETVREKDGLAMSSRNAYLKASERKRALVISRTLLGLRDQIQRGARDLSRLKRQGILRLKKSVDRIDYLEIVDPETLQTLARPQPKMAALAACYVGKTRLIDNVIIRW